MTDTYFIFQIIIRLNLNFDSKTYFQFYRLYYIFLNYSREVLTFIIYYFAQMINPKSHAIVLSLCMEESYLHGNKTPLMHIIKYWRSALYML